MPRNITLHSWNVVPGAILRPAGDVSAAFAALGIHDFRAAVAYVARLSYGRNTDREVVLGVLRERRGTCSTKHALLQTLAIEQGLNTHLMLAIYLMNGRNTAGVASVLKKYAVARIPEAHCYLWCEQRRVDATCPAPTRVLPVIYEEEISPAQIGSYKVELHRRFLTNWANKVTCKSKYEVQELWQIREKCIAALERRSCPWLIGPRK